VNSVGKNLSASGLTCENAAHRYQFGELAPAAGRGEHCCPAAVAIIAVVGLHVALSARHRVQPAWVVPAVLLAVTDCPGTRAASTGGRTASLSVINTLPRTKRTLPPAWSAIPRHDDCLDRAPNWDSCAV
jgi:hypothetical protein